MATSSFHEDLVLDSSLAVAGMQNAIDACGILESVIPYEKVRLCTDRSIMDKFMKGRWERKPAETFHFESSAKF